MNPSERIRAALSRPEGGRPSSEPAVIDRAGLEPAEGTQRTRPAIEVSEEVMAALLGPHAATAEPAASEAGVDVETTLPLIGAGEPKRVENAAPARTAAPLAPERSTPLAKERLAPRSEEKAQRPGWVLPAGVGVAVVAGLCLFLVLRPHGAPPLKQSEPAAPLQLKVEAAGNGAIGVSWNPRSAAVAQAREGRLVITAAGQQPRGVTLDSEQLRGGHTYYQSSAERVEFRLEVYGRSGAMEKETVVAVSPSAAAQAGRELALAAPPTVPKAQNAPANAAQTSSNQVIAGPRESAKALDAAPATPVVRTFTAPPRQPTADAPRVVVLDPSAAVPGAPMVAHNMILPEALSHVAPPPMNQIPAPANAAPPALSQVRVGGDLQAAKLMKRVKPDYPALARSAHIQGAVRFTATIGKDGAVQNLRLVSGPRMLVQAASDAVKQWIYRPTTLNGRAVEVLTQIEVNFTLVE